MSEIATMGRDLAKTVFQAHGADASGRTILRKNLRRDQALAFSGQLPRRVVAREARGGPYFREREIARPGPEVRLIAPACVKPFVRRQSEADMGPDHRPRSREVSTFHRFESWLKCGMPLVRRV